MTMENQPSISRRGLLKWAGAGSIALAAAGALSACSPAQSELASTQGDTGAETDSALQERYADLPVEESSAYAVIVGGGAGGLLAAYKLAKEPKALYYVEGKHNEWIFDGDPKLEGLCAAMNTFFKAHI